MWLIKSENMNQEIVSVKYITPLTQLLYSHYENMQYTEIFSAVKIENFTRTILIFFLIFAQNIDCGYTLEPPRRGSSNEYPQSMFWSKIRKIGLPLHIPILLYKSGVQGGIHYMDMFS